MNEGLFKKHIQQILSRTNEKKKIIIFIKEATGIDIQEDEITFSKKLINLSTSSAKKSIMFQKGLKKKLEEIGYALKI